MVSFAINRPGGRRVTNQFVYWLLVTRYWSQGFSKPLKPFIRDVCSSRIRIPPNTLGVDPQRPEEVDAEAVDTTAARTRSAFWS